MKNTINYKKTLAYYKKHNKKFFKENAGEVIVLHHKDLTLKKENPTRYAEWRIEDVVPMTRRQHTSLHQKGIHMSKAELAKRRAKMAISNKLRAQHAGLLIKITAKDGTVQFASTQREAARMLGVSRQMIYYVLSDNWPHYKTASRCKLSWISTDQILK